MFEVNLELRMRVMDVGNVKLRKSIWMPFAPCPALCIDDLACGEVDWDTEAQVFTCFLEDRDFVNKSRALGYIDFLKKRGWDVDEEESDEVSEA